MSGGHIHIAKRLRALAEEMKDVANDLCDINADRAAELKGAAGIAVSWADAIEDEAHAEPAAGHGRLVRLQRD